MGPSTQNTRQRYSRSPTPASFSSSWPPPSPRQSASRPPRLNSIRFPLRGGARDVRALRVPCPTCNAAIGNPCKWGDTPHDARVWVARSILGAPVSAASLGPVAAKRRSKRAAPKPAQLDLPLDLAAAVAASIARFEVPAESPIQSAAAAAVTEMVAVANEAMADLQRKTRKRVRS